MDYTEVSQDRYKLWLALGYLGGVVLEFGDNGDVMTISINYPPEILAYTEMTEEDGLKFYVRSDIEFELGFIEVSEKTFKKYQRLAMSVVSTEGSMEGETLLVPVDRPSDVIGYTTPYDGGTTYVLRRDQYEELKQIERARKRRGK